MDQAFRQRRRDFLTAGGGGFAGLAASVVLAEPSSVSGGMAELARSAGALVPELPGTAKSVIFLFMEGGPSHLDLFDPKPLLNQLAGQQLPASFGDVITPMGESRSPLLASRRRWRQHG